MSGLYETPGDATYPRPRLLCDPAEPTSDADALARIRALVDEYDPPCDYECSHPSCDIIRELHAALDQSTRNARGNDSDVVP